MMKKYSPLSFISFFKFKTSQLSSFSLKKLSVGLFLLGGIGFIKAQISPPGLGDAHTASWAAFGVKHQLDSSGKKQALSYVATGSKSSPDNNNLFSRQAIIVRNWH